MLRIALPNKGRLAEKTNQLLAQIGLETENRSARALRAPLGNGLQAIYVRAEDIPSFVADGAADLGITGRDRVEEAGRPVEKLLDLGFGRCRLAVAIPDEHPAREIDDIPAGSRVATSFPRLAARFFEQAGLPVHLVPVSGSTEITPHLGVADLIVDLVSTGSTLEVNGLREIATILESSAWLIGNPAFLRQEGTAPRVRELQTALESVLLAQNKRYLMANVPREALPRVREILPGLDGPTVIDVMNGGRMVAVHAVVEHRELYRTIASLKALGGSGILVTRIERLAP